jgi:serine/threonine protein kinase
MCYVQVSQEGQDLMHRLLQPDPQKRLTMGQVMDHPWFQRSLPPPLMTLNARCASLQLQVHMQTQQHAAASCPFEFKHAVCVL